MKRSGTRTQNTPINLDFMCVLMCKYFRRPFIVKHKETSSSTCLFLKVFTFHIQFVKNK